MHFSEEEAFILSKAIHDIDSDSEFKQKLSKKLYSLYDFDRVAHAITKKEDSENILKILQGIKKNKRVILKNYHSGNSKTIRDRLVEPIDFTYHYTSLWAFDPEDKINKLFRTSRYSEVIVTVHPIKYKREHKKGEIDVFRVTGYETIKVQLNLTLRAYTLLIEEFPLAVNDIEKLSTGEYIFTSKVCGLEGISRFVMGLPEEVTIISPPKLKEHVRKKARKLML